MHDICTHTYLYTLGNITYIYMKNSFPKREKRIKKELPIPMSNWSIAFLKRTLLICRLPYISTYILRDFFQSMISDLRIDIGNQFLFWNGAYGLLEKRSSFVHICIHMLILDSNPGFFHSRLVDHYKKRSQAIYNALCAVYYIYSILHPCIMCLSPQSCYKLTSLY